MPACTRTRDPAALGKTSLNIDAKRTVPQGPEPAGTKGSRPNCGAAKQKTYSNPIARAR